MPAKRIILLDRPPNALWYRYVLWADVPAANQIAYRNPFATSAYANAMPADIQAIRDGLVAERVGQYQSDLTTLGAVQAALQPIWTAFQNEVNAEIAWNGYGSYWDGTLWNTTPGVPLFSAREGAAEGLPTFSALTPVSAFAANKFHLVLYNGMSSTLGQGLILKVRLVVILPGIAVVTGVQPSAWSLQRRVGPTTPPSGTGGVTVGLFDSAQALPASSGLTAWNAPGTSPAGGTVTVFNQFVPQADEAKLTTLDAPTVAPLFSDCGGQVIYRAGAIAPCRPLVIRPGETMEVQQSATGGTGNCQVLCIFTLG